MARHTMGWKAAIDLVLVDLCLALDRRFAAPSYAWSSPPCDCMYIPNGVCLLWIFGSSPTVRRLVPSIVRGQRDCHQNREPFTTPAIVVLSINRQKPPQ